MHRGYIKLYRRVRENPLWQDESWFRAWTDILLEAWYDKDKPKIILIQKRRYEVGYAQVLWSTRFMAERWGWSLGKVLRFIKRLKTDTQIDTDTSTGMLRITVLNYPKYHGEPEADGNSDGNSDGYTNGTATEQQRNEKKKYKEVKESQETKEENTLSGGNGKHPATTPPPYREIIEYLNLKSGKRFKHDSDETRKFIRARWNKGYRMPDFKAVIDKKCAKWLTEAKMIDFVRPQTLFGTKFEAYLNETDAGGNEPDYMKRRRAERERTCGPH